MIRRNQPEEPTIPQELDAIAKLAMYWQIASSYAEETYKDVKKDFFQRMEANPNIEMQIGKSLKVSVGKVRWQGRANFDIDQAEIEKALDSGRITVPVLLAMVKSYDTDAVKQFCPAAVIEKPATEYGVMVANADYKAEVCERVDALRDFAPQTGPVTLPDNVAVMKAPAADLTPALEASVADVTAKKASKPRSKKAAATA